MGYKKITGVLQGFGVLAWFLVSGFRWCYGAGVWLFEGRRAFADCERLSFLGCLGAGKARLSTPML